MESSLPEVKTSLPKVRTSYEALRALFDESTHLIWLLSPEGTITDLNLTILNRVGEGAETSIGAPLWHAPLWLPGSAELLRATLNSWDGAPIAITLECQSRAEEQFWLELLLKPIHGSDGTLQCVMAEGRDLSRHRQVVEHLITHEMLLDEGQSLAHMGSWVHDIRTNRFIASNSLNRIFGLDPMVKHLTLEAYHAAVHPEDSQMIKRLTAEFMESGNTPEYDMRIRRSDGESRILHASWRAERDSQQNPIYLFGISQDVTEQRQLESRMAQTVQRLSTLTSLAQALTARWHDTDLYEHVTAMVRALVNAQTIVLMIYEQGHLVVRSLGGESDSALIGQAIELDIGISAHTWQTGEATVVRGAQSQSRLNPLILQSLSYPPQVTVAVPMAWENRRVGVIKVLHSDPNAFSEEDIGLLQVVGAWFTIALMNARLWQEQQRARNIAEQQREKIRALAQRLVSAQEAERRRLGRELHDETGQVLTALKIKLSLMQKSLSDPEQQAGIEEAKGMVSDMMNNVRHIAHALRPPALDTFGLAASLEGLCRDITRHTGLDVRYEGETLPACSDEVNIALFRFVQEALTNVAKHAQATEVLVRTHMSENHLIVEVRDNGRGFDTEQAASGIGLLGMEERVEWVGGTLEIQSAPGEGASLKARVPLPE